MPWPRPLLERSAFSHPAKEGQEGGVLHPESVAELQVKPLVVEVW